MATGEVYGPSHDYHTDTIIHLQLSPQPLVRLAHPIETIMLQHLINLISHHSYW